MPDRAPSPSKARSPLAALVAVVATIALVAACGDGDATAPAGGPRPDPVAGGWIGGEPQWRLDGGGSEDSGGDGAATASGGAADMAASPEEMAGGPATTVPGASARPGSVTATAVDDLTTPAEATTVPPMPGDPGTPLRAGSVDDNEDFAGYLDYLRRLRDAGVVTRDLDPTGRIVVTVTGADGRPVSGAEVVVSHGGAEVGRLRTTADGTARFLPALHGAPTDGIFDVAVGATTTSAPAGGTAALQVDHPGGAAAPVPVDVLFLLDATGSMGDEIGRLKATVDSVAERLAALPAAPDLRLGMTLYRDEGDTFVTSTFDLTGDVAAFRAALAGVVADGGGDYPEALDEGLAEALAAPSWRDPASTVQLVFVVADAPPQVGRQVTTPYPASVLAAVGRGIKVFPVASSGTDDQAEAVFRQIAQATGGRLVFLSYGAGGAALGGSSDIASTDYEELALDDLVVRLVAEELAALTGDDATVPPPSTTTSTTNPPGQ
jgi:hypothetical protein